MHASLQVRIFGIIGLSLGIVSSVQGQDAAVYVATHVDVPPPLEDRCVEALQKLVAGSRKEAGIVRFEVFQHGIRPNQFTVVESVESSWLPW